jgi:hypothetical protein
MRMRKAPAKMNTVVAGAMRHVRVAFMGPGAIIVERAYRLVAVHYLSQFLQPPASQTPDKIITITHKRPKTIGALVERILHNIHLARGKSAY